MKRGWASKRSEPKPLPGRGIRRGSAPAEDAGLPRCDGSNPEGVVMTGALPTTPGRVDPLRCAGSKPGEDWAAPKPKLWLIGRCGPAGA